jgi:hypothetical protein
MAMAEYMDNPAGWLLSNLNYLVLRGKEVQPAKSDINVSAALKEMSEAITGRTNASDSDTAHYVLELSKLPVGAREEVYALRHLLTEAIIDHMLRWYPNVILALSVLVSPSSKFNTFITRIKPDVLTALEECSELLHIHRPQPTLEEDKLARLRELINDLLDALENDAAIDADLRTLLLRQVRAMEMALLNARIMGAPVVEEALAETIGSLYLNWKLIARWDTSPGTWQKVTAVLSAIAAALSLGTAAIQALEPQPPTSRPAIETVIVVEPSGAAHVSQVSSEDAPPGHAPNDQP